MSADSRPAFDDEDVEDLCILIRLAVDFQHFLNGIPPWPHVPDDPVHNMHYKLDSVFVNIDSFHNVLRTYCILVGATTTTIDWASLRIASLKDTFLAVYQSFLTAPGFETKCRLLLDLMKLQIVFAGAWYDCDSRA